VPRRNRVDPWGDLQAVPDRGLLTGNRGCLVDDAERVVRHHGARLWIACLLQYKDWRVDLARPGRWTPVFFLDDAVALAAGHRPCGLCRREDHRAYQRGVTQGLRAHAAVSAAELDRRLAAERLRRGRGIDRAGDRIVWTAEAGELPSGTVIVDGSTPRLLLDDRMLAFGFAGWHSPAARPRRGSVQVLTPPTSVVALAHGYAPLLHPSATRD
jgi:hypothetical protein